MQPDYRYTMASENELDELLAGREAGLSVAWSAGAVHSPSSAGFTGVMWTRGNNDDDPVRPWALVSQEDDVRRLCGRYAQLRSDLSPLTSWCHLLTPQYLFWLDSLTRCPDLGGMEAAWTGLIIAEAMLLSERSVSAVRIPACLATQSFAIARTKSLWKNIPLDTINKRFDAAVRLSKKDRPSPRGESRTAKVRSALQPIWTSMIGILPEHASTLGGELGPIAASLRALRYARADKDPKEARNFAMPLLNSVPEALEFDHLTNLTPEMRLRTFDKLVDALNKTNDEPDSLRRNSLALLAGYLATIAAGGAPSLALAENVADRWPEITAWAYLVGGIGEKVVWTASFDGLGRLVARELMRPMRLDEPPTCDFAFDEGAILADSKLSDPLVHLRLKQVRIATVALFPGVNVSVPIADMVVQELGKQQPTPGNRPQQVVDRSVGGRDLIAALADALWPHLRPRVEDRILSAQDEHGSTNATRDTQANRSRRRIPSQSELPLKNSRR